MPHAGLKLTIFLVFTGLVTGLLALILSDHRGGSDPREYAVELTDASLLTPGSAVRVAGVDVGRVGELTYLEANRIRVAFEVDGAITLPANVLARVRYKNLVGDRFLELAEPADPTGRLAAGATIPVANSSPAVNIDQLVGGFKPLLSALDPEQVNTLSANLLAVLNGQENAVTFLLDDIAAVTTSVADREVVVDRVIRNLETVLGAVNRRRDGVSSLVADMQRLVSGLNRDRDPLVQAVVHLRDLTSRSAELLGQTRPDLAALVRSARAVAANVNSDDAAVNAFLSELGNAYDAIAGIGVYGDFFNFFLCDVRVRTGVEGKIVDSPWVESSLPRCTGEGPGDDR